MMKQFEKERWLTADAEKARRKILDILWTGGRILPEHSLFGLKEGLADFAGLQVPHKNTIKGISIANANFTQASFQQNWIEQCTFENVIFDAAELMGVRDHANHFINCSFIKTDFRAAGLGCRGSIYKNCIFDRSLFNKTGFIHPEFDDCVFSKCKLGGVDFNASSFVHCIFKGKITNVWFRGGYGYPNDEAEFGKARKNEMKNVSFADASLWNITFSNHCNLSAIILPKKGNYKLFDNWKNRVEHLIEIAESMPEHDRYEASIFAKSFLGHAAKQEWYLINCDEVIRDYGQGLGTKIIEALSEIG